MNFWYTTEGINEKNDELECVYRCYWMELLYFVILKYKLIKRKCIKIGKTTVVMYYLVFVLLISYWFLFNFWFFKNDDF